MEDIEMIDTSPNWMTPMAAYLITEELPDYRNEARKMRRKATRYIIVEGVMYRRGFSVPLLWCVTQEEAGRLLSEVHDGFCGNHAVGKSLSKKILRQEYFWQTMIEDSKAYVNKLAHPQANGQVEAVNMTLKDTLKKQLEDVKGNLSEELPEVLWSYHATEKIATGQTPFTMAYDYEAMLPVEFEPPSHRRLTYNQKVNHALLAESLEEVEEK
ncbi:hypothetical protein CsatB_023062 [Cannabis sativa]